MNSRYKPTAAHERPAENCSTWRAKYIVSPREKRLVTERGTIGIIFTISPQVTLMSATIRAVFAITPGLQVLRPSRKYAQNTDTKTIHVPTNKKVYKYIPLFIAFTVCIVSCYAFIANSFAFRH